jgi:hypothetical protein
VSARRHKRQVKSDEEADEEEVVDSGDNSEEEESESERDASDASDTSNPFVDPKSRCVVFVVCVGYYTLTPC